MKVCTTYGTAVPLRNGSEMHEVRSDVFSEVPNGLGKNDIITLCGKDISYVPAGFRGLVDIGNSDEEIKFRKIRSIHDHESTPSSDSIVDLLSNGDQEISKGAFKVNSLNDLNSILEASKRIRRRHVLLGMGETGTVTRIRQSILGNEFTFGYHCRSTAPGQLSSDRMVSLGDDCKIVGLIGHPISHSFSPEMQNAALQDSGINGIYLRFDTPDLRGFREVMFGYDILGVNVTIPYKQSIIQYLDGLSDTAEKVGAVNTVLNKDGMLIGFNTDVSGIEYAFSGIGLKGKKVLIMGSGGAARSAAFVFTGSGCEVSISARNERTRSEIVKDFGVCSHPGDVSGFDIIVNCTPIGIVEGKYPSDISTLHEGQIVFDMVYGRETPLLKLAGMKGCTTIDGRKMLIGQGASSFRIWFGFEPNREVMEKAIL